MQNVERPADIARRIVEEVLAEAGAETGPSTPSSSEGVAVPATPASAPATPASVPATPASAPAAPATLASAPADPAAPDDDSAASLARRIVAEVVAEHEARRGSRPADTADAGPVSPGPTEPPAPPEPPVPPEPPTSPEPPASPELPAPPELPASPEPPAPPTAHSTPVHADHATADAAPARHRARPVAPTALLPDPGWTEERPALPAAEPHPLRWVLATVVAAISLAVLLPLAVAAVRALVP